MWKPFLGTRLGWEGLVLRLALGCVMFPHGAQKALGLFDGPGFQATLDGFAKMEIPQALGVLAIAAEFLGSIGLIVGFLTRLCALGIGTVMAVAVMKVHWANGFFMNWQGTQKGEGFEYHILAAAIALALVIGGAGYLSIDRSLARPRGA